MMKERTNRFPKTSRVDFLLLRDRLGISKYRKTRERNPEKRKILLELALSKIRKAEKNDYIPQGFRKRRVLINPKG